MIDAINNASRTFDEVANSLEQVAGAEIAAAEAARALSDAELQAAQRAVDAVAAYEELRSVTDGLVASSTAAMTEMQRLEAATWGVSGASVTAGQALGQLSDEQLAAANTAIAARAGLASEVESLLGVYAAAHSAADATQEMSVAEILAAGSAATAAEGFRSLTSEELAAAAGATATAVAVRALSDAELAAANQAAVFAVATRALSDEELAAANAAVVLRAALAGVAEEETTAAVKSAGLAAGLAALSASLAESSSMTGSSIQGFGFWGTVVGGLFAKIPLWGGLLDGLLPKFLTVVSGWHLLADAALEVVAVWTPAAVAIAAFGLAASDAVMEVGNQLQDLHTVADATGQSIPPLTGNLEKLHDAVRPDVYQIFGDALTVAASKAGSFNSIITQTGTVLTQLAARTAVALQSTNVDVFMKNAVSDVQLLGTAFGNLFGIIGNLIRAVPGYAEILLSLGTGFLGLIENITGLAEPLISAGLWFHGFVVYVGLAVTVAVKLGSVLAGWGAAVVTAVTDLIGLGTALSAYVAEVGLATAATEALDAISPMAWVGIAAGAIAALTFVVLNNKDAITSWGDSLEHAVTSAKSLSAGAAALHDGLFQVNQRMTQLAQSGQAVQGALTAGGQVVQRATTQYGELSKVQDQLSGQQQLYNTRLSDLAAKYGGVSNAMVLLNQSGVTMDQMLKGGAAAWDMIKQQVAATNAGFQAMSDRTGIVGNDLQLLRTQQDDVNQSIQKVNQAWQQQIGAMTGAQSSFDTVAQGLDVLGSDSAKLTEKLGNFKLTVAQTKAPIDQLSTAGIALNQAFSQQVGNIDSMAASWRTAGIDSGLFTAGIAGAIAPLEKYAQGSTEATAQLAALAEEAGYQGPASLKQLNQFLGITSSQLKNTSGDLAAMKAAANQATIQEALLSSSMQAQGNMIAGQLIGDINQAILAYNGVKAAAAAYGNAIAEDGRQSDAAKAARATLISDLISSGKAANDTTGQIAAMITKITGIPKNVAIQMVMSGVGSFQIQGLVSSGASVPGITQGAPIGVRAASGAYIRAGSGPRSDDVLAAVSHGELVVPTHMVNAGAVDHLRGKIPGFAGGGLVLAGNRSVLTGDYAVSSFNQFEAAGISGMESAMLSAARGAGASFADGGVVGGDGASIPVSAIMALSAAYSPFGNTAGQVFGGGGGATAMGGQGAQAQLAAQQQLTNQLRLQLVATQQLVAQLRQQAAAAAQQTTTADTATSANTTATTTATAATTANTAALTASTTTAKTTSSTAAKATTSTPTTAAVKTASASTVAQLKTMQAAEEKAYNQAVSKLQAQLANPPKGMATTQIKDDLATLEKRQSAELAQYKTTIADPTNKLLGNLINLVHQEFSTAGDQGLSKLGNGLNMAALQKSLTGVATAITTAEKSIAKTTSTASGAKTGSSSGSASFVTTTATSTTTDKTAEASLATLVTTLKQVDADLKSLLTALTSVKTNTDPAAQAKAIGPAVASALNSVAGRAVTASTTRRG